MFTSVPTGIATGVAGSLMSKEVINTIAAAGNFVPAAGAYFFYLVGANIQLQILDSGGNWQNITAVGVGGYFETDGTNVRFVNGGGGNQTVNTIKLG